MKYPEMKAYLLALFLSIATAGNLSNHDTLPLAIEIPPNLFEMPAEPDPVPLALVWPIHLEDYMALSSPFGERDPEKIGGYGDDFHDGLDLFGTWRARVLAVADGVVTEHYPPPNGYYRGHPVYGGYIEITHDDGSISRYAHLSETDVVEDLYVAGGIPIGRQGKTGRTAKAHLHFELEIEGKKVNPLKYLEEP